MDENVGGLVILWVIVVVIYFLPGMVAKSRGHHQYTAILVLNLLLGWTVVGWVIALVWASSAVQNKGQ